MENEGGNAVSTAIRGRHHLTASDDPLYPEDFDDVFGGPPRMSLSRQFSPSGFQRSPSSSPAGFSYEEIFQTPTPPVVRVGRSLPRFRIPGQRNNDFYRDIFGWEDHDRAVGSEASSSPLLSSEELSPLRPAVSVTGYDDASYFASKLRAINVESRRTTTRMAFDENKQDMMQPPVAFRQPYCNNNDNNNNTDHSNFKSYSFPETISQEPMSNGSMGVSAEDLDIKSTPLSPVSAVYQSSNQGWNTQGEEEDLSSYVIEIDSENREEMCGSNGVDDAIAWVKEKFQMKSPSEEMSNGYGVSDQGLTDSFGIYNGTGGQSRKNQNNLNIRNANTGCKNKFVGDWKEADIRLLLSSLDQILWPACGWLVIPANSLVGISQVTKAYQKAGLCLHPDKVQQRGATIPHKHIAKKTFYILQDAWEAFVAKEV